MIRYLAAFFILICGYYTLTYGISLWRDDKNKLASIGAFGAAAAGTLLPIAYMFYRM